MTNIFKNSKMLAGAALLSSLTLAGTSAMAVDVSVPVTAVVQSTINITTTPLDFGTIDIDPIGDTITLNATASSVTIPTILGGSAVTGASSGTIVVSSPTSFGIAITYPADGTTLMTGVLGNTTSVVLNAVTANSTTSPIAHVGGVDDTINVGGALVLAANTPSDTYTGAMTVVFVYN